MSNPSRSALLSLAAFVASASLVSGCDRQEPAPKAEDPLPPPAFAAVLPKNLQGRMFEKFTGDFDQMVQRKVIRIGVPFNRTFYFIDKGTQRGAAYEMGKAFEDDLNKRLTTGNAKVHVVFIPLPRELLASALTEGKVDFVAAQVTVRPDLQSLVAFTRPTRTNVSEVVVTGPGGPTLATAEDLSGKEVWVRRDSKYYASLVALNAALKAKGKPPVTIHDVPASLEDDDVLEMVNAGLIPITVVDDYLAEFWKKTFTDITVHEAAAVRTGGNLALAVRKGSPQLTAALNGFLDEYGLGTAFGNVIEKRYLVSTTYVRNAASEAERKKFQELSTLFQKYSSEYDVDYLLMAAQGYQESGLNQAVKSPVGAIGVMQLMPATGAEQKVGDIAQVDPNIHAGVKYMRFMRDQYFKGEPMTDLDKGLFTLASYNAGPGRVRQLRREAAARGLNPNVWFGNVEQIASERIGRETVTYVSNVYKYYLAYQLIVGERSRREAARKALEVQAHN